MEIVKIIGVGFITLIITIILKEYRRDFAIFAVLIGGAIILYFSFDMLSGIISFINTLNEKSNTGFISVLLKITGISILTEYAVSICKDSGENSIANKIDFRRKNNCYFNVNSNNINNFRIFNKIITIKRKEKNG